MGVGFYFQRTMHISVSFNPIHHSITVALLQASRIVDTLECPGRFWLGARDFTKLITACGRHGYVGCGVAWQYR